MAQPSIGRRPCHRGRTYSTGIVIEVSPLASWALRGREFCCHEFQTLWICGARGELKLLLLAGLVAEPDKTVFYRLLSTQFADPSQ